MDELARNVIEFVAAQTGHKVSKLGLDSRLFHDLGVDGDDGLELLQAFSRRYSVPIDGVETSRYFGPEASLGMVSLVRSLLSPKHKAGREMAPIHIRDLVVCAREQKWML
jgi:hypothetical protein